ncbi:MAG: hypothetical protein R2787_13180 [Saprospiraceae bacterium]
MVTNLQRQWLGYILSGLLLVSTSGIPVHKLVCLCKGEQTIQFYAEPDGCCSPADQTAEPGCCSGHACQAASACSATGHTCQDKEVSILKIVDQFLDSGTTDHDATVSALPPPAPHMFWLANLAVSDDLPGKVQPQRYKRVLPSASIIRMGCQLRC